MSLNESIVLVGGGGGVYRVARSLKNIRSNITTIQTVFDHGGHSGFLRDERGVLPPGDIRQAILALSEGDSEPSLRKLMAYRFEDKKNSTLNGNTVGNILLTALTEIEGSLPNAIKALSKLCGVRGNVLPVSLDDAELCVELTDGTILRGEGSIDNRSIDDNRSIRRAFLEPNAHIFVDAYKALVEADKIVLCPGDTYTSLVPNLLVDGFSDAILETQAKIIYVVNIMTKKAETHGFSVQDFVREVHSHLKRDIDFVLYNKTKLSQVVIESYRKEKSEQVVYQGSDGTMVRKYMGLDLADETGGVVRHHERVTSIIADL
jgi:uncharacterized cofD-like protein